MKRSAERRIGAKSWLLGIIFLSGLLVLLFSVASPSILEGELPLGIRRSEVASYAALLDRRPHEGSNVQVNYFRFGGSHTDGECVMEITGTGWSDRWFEADGYGDSVKVRRLRTVENGYVVKFAREAPYKSQRQVVLIPATAKSIRAKYLEILATELGLVTPEVSFVRVLSCGRDLGLYLKEERIGQEFLEKHGMPDGALFSAGFDPERPDELMPAFEGDTLAASTLRSMLQQAYVELDEGSTSALPLLVDEQAAAGWLLMRWFEGGADPFAEEGLFVYRWTTGRILPIYRRGRDIGSSWEDPSAPVGYSPMTALLRRPSFRAAVEERLAKLQADRTRIEQRFDDADEAWLPILVGEASLSVAKARAGELADELLEVRLTTGPTAVFDRPLVRGPGYATLIRADSTEQYWPISNDHERSQRISEQLHARRSGDTLTFPRGQYRITEDLIIPFGTTVVLEQGARFSIAAGRSVLCLGALHVRGTRRNPVFIRPMDPDAPFGSFAVTCPEGAVCSISGLQISGGSEARINGLYHSGMFSIHGASRTTLVDCIISGSAGEDALNIKGGEVLLQNCVFENGEADLVDLDFVTGEVRNCTFQSGRMDSNGDGLDVSGSRVVVENCRFDRMMDKGVSSGEASQVLVRKSHFTGNRLAIASKDLSIVHVADDQFSGNELVFGVYRKKAIYGGAHLYLYSNFFDGNVREREVDSLSTIVSRDSLTADVLKLFGVEPTLDHDTAVEVERSMRPRRRSTRPTSE